MSSLRCLGLGVDDLSARKTTFSGSTLFIHSTMSKMHRFYLIHLKSQVSSLKSHTSNPHLASKQKTGPQALRPAPASISFYPAEKKVSKENGGHGMEHVLREVSCGRAHLIVRVLFSNETKGACVIGPPR